MPDPLGAGDDSGGKRSILQPQLSINGDKVTVDVPYTVSGSYTEGGRWDADIYAVGGGGACAPGCLSKASPTAQLNDNFDYFDPFNPFDSAAGPGIIDGDTYSCPSYYYNYDSPFANDGSTSDVTTYSGKYLAWNVSAANVGKSSCQGDGVAAVFSNINMSPGSHGASATHDFKVTFQFKSHPSTTSLSFEVAIFCGDIDDATNGCPDHAAGGNDKAPASWYDNGVADSTWKAARGGGDIYYWDTSPVYVTIPIIALKGKVVSDPNQATGKGFANVPLYDCSGGGSGPYPTASWTDGSGNVFPNATTDSSGNFSVAGYQHSPFCITTTAYPTTAYTYQGTNYSGVACATNQNSGADGYTDCSSDQISGVCDQSTSCGSTNPYSLIYAPTGSPKVSVTENPPAGGNGTSLKPGDTVSYTVTLDNNLDYNIGYSPGSNALVDTLSDAVPGNIDPTTISGGSSGYSIGSDGSPNMPAGWTVNSAIPCFSGSYGFGAYNGSGLLFTPTYISCGSSGGGVETLSFSVLPAYASVSFTFSGTVKTAANIGVYPDLVQQTDPNCATGTGNTVAALISGCQDFSAGLEGVYDLAGFDGPSTPAATANTWVASNQLYNPIPAAVGCLSKFATGFAADDGHPSKVPDCYGGNQYQYYAYSPGTASSVNGNGASTGTIEIQVKPDPGQGPLYYQLYDQGPGGGVNSQIAVQTGTQSPGEGTITGSQLVSWDGSAGDGEELSGSQQGSYNFQVSLANATGVPVGGTISNTATLCVIEYWASGHPTDCNAPADGTASPDSAPGTSNPSVPIYFTRYQNLAPYLTTTGGNVHAGGCSQSTTSATQTCDQSSLDYCSSTTDTGLGNAYDNIVYNNGASGSASGAIGQYLVSAGDNLSANPYAGVQSGSSSGIPSANGTGVVIRPNLCAAAQTIWLKQGSAPTAPTVLGGSSYQSGFSSGSYNDDHSDANLEGKVVLANPPAAEPGLAPTVHNTYVLGSTVDGSGTSPALPNLVINHRWTLYVTGNLFINANITYGSNNPSGALNAETNHPSLGVIVTGNIYIGKGVTTLDGFYVAGGITNTCAAADGSSLSYQVADVAGPAPGSGPYSVGDCNTPLTVNGLLYADTFRFNRTYGYANANSGASETVNYDQRLYTATPPAFNDLADSSLLSKYLVEPLPRY
ncbi:MAG: hypothetical protein ABSG64_14315 [Solirubrobacteraceae bacterium]|jgi:hypothetical protein